MIFSALSALAFVLSYCGTSKKAVKQTVKMNYDLNVKAILEADCAPCHFPAKGGKKHPLDSYAEVSKNIDDILRRVQLNPDERGFMPRDHSKLSDSTINILKQWKDDGMPEN